MTGFATDGFDVDHVMGFGIGDGPLEQGCKTGFETAGSDDFETVALVTPRSLVETGMSDEMLVAVEPNAG